MHTNTHPNINSKVNTAMNHALGIGTTGPMNITGDKELFSFLTNAPKDFREGEKIRKYQLKNGDYIHCVLWDMHFYITGTDIVKILCWRFQNAGRTLVSMKKFEEGVFSDLRNLKPNIDAKLESPRSPFLEFLYKNGCIRTQKKQKVFFWYSVPHDALFCDALERDLRRETNLFTYSKYMSSLNHPVYHEGIELYANVSPFGKQVALKRKNSLKFPSRGKRSPRDQESYRGAPRIMQNPKTISPPSSSLLLLDQSTNILGYNAFNPTQPDPFTTFDKADPFTIDYNDLGYTSEYGIGQIDYASFDPLLKKEEDEEKTYAMPDLFGNEKADRSDKEGPFSKARKFTQNIPNQHGKPQK